VSQRIRQVQGQSFTRRAEALSSNPGACNSSHFVTENQSSESTLDISEPTLESLEQDFKFENFKTMDKLLEDKDIGLNYALETIPEYLHHSKAITYQIQLTLTSTFDDMRCTLLRLLEKVKKLELKNRTA
ncbi:hypothetical protein Avbf_16098, partial [Armadillidium vulgare]